jgi:hypothetical protein
MRLTASSWHVDWPRLARRTLLIAVAICAVVDLYANSRGIAHGLDFHGGIWKAGQDILAGRSPYTASDAQALLLHSNAFITPPLLAELALPLSALRVSAALVLWNIVCVGALVWALILLGLRDRRVFVVVLCSFPVVASIDLGQPDGLFALAVAVAWRWRDSQRGAVAVGAVVAAKLFFLPLIAWLLVTRRVRLAATAAASAVALLVVSWACIGFKGLSNYPHLLAADARAFETRSHSVVAAVMRMGASEQLARPLAMAIALLVALAIVRAARGSDLGWFAAALLAGLFSSPILWSHYLVVLLVPLAIAVNGMDPVWTLAAAFWLSPLEPPSSNVQVVLVLVSASGIALVAAFRDRQRSRSLDVRLGRTSGSSVSECMGRGYGAATDPPSPPSAAVNAFAGLESRVRKEVNSEDAQPFQRRPVTASH